MLLIPGQQADGSGTFFPGRTSQGGVMLELAADQVIAHGSGTTETLIWHATPLWDPDNIWTGGASDTFTVPSGWTHLRVISNFRYGTDTDGARRFRVLVNDVAGALHGGCTQSNPDSSSQIRMNLVSGIIAVAENDTIKVDTTQTSGGNLSVEKDQETWIAIFKWNGIEYTHVKLAATIELTTATSIPIPFDTEVLDNLEIANVAQDPSLLNTPPGGGLYRIYGGIEIDAVAEDISLGFANSDENVLGDGFPKTNMRENVSEFGCFDNIYSPVQLPSTPSYEDVLKLLIRHTHGSDRTLLSAFMQVERADDAFATLLQSSADQTISNATVTTITYDTTLWGSSPGVFTGGSSGSIVVPAVPGGGSWAYAILTMTKTGSGNTFDRYFEMQVDTGGGFADWKGIPAIIQQASSSGEPTITATGVYPSPSATDEFRVFWWQNTSGNETIDGDTELSDQFTLELFHAP